MFRRNFFRAKLFVSYPVFRYQLKAQGSRLKKESESARQRYLKKGMVICLGFVNLMVRGTIVVLYRSKKTMNIKAQVRSVGELLTAVAPILGATFVTNEAVILSACLKQVQLDGTSTSRGGSFGGFAVSKVLATIGVVGGLQTFTPAEKALIAACWSVIHAGNKVAGFKF